MHQSKILSVMAAALCLLSCQRRPLDVLATSLRVDLTNDYSLPFEPPYAVPEHYRVNMYDRTSGKLVYKDFVPEKGGTIRSTPGDYICYVCNFDEGFLILRGEGSTESIYLTAPEAEDYYRKIYLECLKKHRSIVDEAGSDDSTPVLKVESFFWAGAEEATVPVLSPTDDIHTIYVNTNSVLKQGYVTLSNIRGAEYIAKIDCFVTNLCAGVNPLTRELDSTGVSQAFTIKAHDGAANGTFLYFGIRPGGEPHFLYALVTDTGGGQYLYIYDLGQIDDERGLHFDIDSEMIIPEPSTEGGGGFQPELGNWQTVIIKVPIGIQL